MKYLRHINESEGNVSLDVMKEYFYSIINWDMVNDVKEMSLEYLDVGCSLEIDFHFKIGNVYYNFMDLNYTHDIDNIVWYDVSLKDSYEKMILFNSRLKWNIAYRIMIKRGTNGSYQLEETDELLDRIKEAYTDEIIG